MQFATGDVQRVLPDQIPVPVEADRQWRIEQIDGCYAGTVDIYDLNLGGSERHIIVNVSVIAIYLVVIKAEKKRSNSLESMEILIHRISRANIAIIKATHRGRAARKETILQRHIIRTVHQTDGFSGAMVPGQQAGHDIGFSTYIARFVKRGAVINAETLGLSGSEILQLRVQPDCPWLGKTLMDLPFPREAVIGAVLKRGRVETPTGGTLLEDTRAGLCRSADKLRRKVTGLIHFRLAYSLMGISGLDERIEDGL